MSRLPLLLQQRPVAHFLNALVLACLLPGILGVTLFVFATYEEDRERLTRQNIESARILGQAIDTQLLRTQALAQSLANSDELTAGQLAAFSQRASRSIAAAGLGSHLVLYRREGERLLGLSSHGSAFAPMMDGAQVARTVLRQGDAVISDVEMDAVSGRPAISIQVPVRRHGELLYSLAIFVPAEHLTELLLARQIADGWLISLLDRRGIIAARNRNGERLIGQVATPNLRGAILRGRTGALETVSRDGVPNFTAYSRSPRTGFTTIIGVPQAEVIAALHSKLLYLGATVASLFVLGLLLARHMSRLIADSIHALVAPASALGEGKTLPVARVHLSESAAVGSAIERAAALLRQHDAALRAQQDELQQFKFFSENANEMLVVLDERGRLRYANRMTTTRLGYSKEELLSMSLSDIDSAFSPARLAAVFERGRHGRLPVFERIYRTRDGAELPVEITATVLEHKGEWLMHVSPRDIGERHQAQQALRWAATHDGLTGLPNRARALAFLEEALGSGAAGALLYIDLGRFKPVNDNHGHETGDRVLREVARRARECMQPDDMLARFGGDEFLAVLRDAGRAENMAGAIVDALARPIRLGNIEVALSACIGISRFPEHGDSAAALLHAADVAMLEMKNAGRASFACYAPDMGSRAQFVLDVERRLQQALEQDGFVLHYQPIIDLATGSVKGIEALVRLADGIEPALGPAQFIPVAEARGLIAPLGEWVAREACRQQVGWRASGIDLTVSINVSALQFRRHDFSTRIHELIVASGIDPRCLVIEVTESAIMENLAEAVGILQALKSLGVRVALDDFGTGYSSLSSLSTLPLDKLKIDQSFVRGIETDHTSRAVIDAVIALGKSLNLELVAEGIETEAALQYLRERGCQLGQGYHFSRPLAADQFLAWHAQELDEST